MTSHDVVSRVRRAVGERRVGHAGTLDPSASGVLVLGIGQGTRLMGLLTAEFKSYVGLVCLGTETTTDDAEGEVVSGGAVPDWALDEARACELVEGLVGEHMQVPPAYSAISIDGVRSYARARAGEAVELAARSVTIREARLLAVTEHEGAPAWLCAFDVSKGCYIRAIARDLGRELGCGAHLAELRRSSSGLVGLGSCVTLEELEREGAGLLASRSLDPAAALGLPVRRLTTAEVDDVACGRRISLGTAEPAWALGAAGRSDGAAVGAGCVRVPENGRVSLVDGTRLLGVWERRGRQLACSVNFPGGITGVRA